MIYCYQYIKGFKMENEAKRFMRINRHLFERVTSTAGAYIARNTQDQIMELLEYESTYEGYFYGDSIYYFSDASCIVRIEDECLVDVDSSMFEE